MSGLEERLKAQAHQLGFELVGIAPAAPADGFPPFTSWLDQGHAGTMDYLHRHRDARRHPASVLPEVRSVIMVGMNYFPDLEEPCPLPDHGRVARYARGMDYHDVLRRKLDQLLDWLREGIPGCQGRSVVDTAPLLERDFARRAGLGWFGRNTMLLNKRLGSYFFLGALLINLALQSDPPFTATHCGTCTACLDACPTQAFVAPYQLDARRCISYLTIELKGSIPEKLRRGMGDWLFGCDVCQEVCPWNRKAPHSSAPEWQAGPGQDVVDLLELLTLSPAAFRERFRGSPLLRSKRRGLLRNAAVVLGNFGTAAALPALEQAGADEEALICEAAVWAINQIKKRLAEQPPLSSSGEGRPASDDK